MVNGVSTVNPGKKIWYRMDRFIISCFNATFTRSVSSGTFGLTTSKQYWDYLRYEFTDQFAARRSLLRGQLQTIRRGNLSVTEYLNNLKEIIDNLAAINDRVSDEDIVMYTLNGLGRDFTQFVITAQHRETPYKFVELHSRLVHHEQWMKNQEHDSNNVFDSTNAPSAFYSNFNRGSNNDRGNSSGRHNNSNRGGNSDRGCNSGRHNNSGRGYHSGRGDNLQRSNFYPGSSSSNSSRDSNGGSSSSNSVGLDIMITHLQIFLRLNVKFVNMMVIQLTDVVFGMLILHQILILLINLKIPSRLVNLHPHFRFFTLLLARVVLLQMGLHHLKIFILVLHL